MAKKQSAPPATTIGDRIRAARTARSLTHEALARAAGLSLDTVQKLQAGKREPSASVIVALCRALEISADELLGITHR
jgi:transcriptional regulator with XRE-family HTH domain